MQRISRFDVNAFANKAKTLVEQQDFSKDATALLAQYSLKMRVSRLELLKREMLLETIALADREVKMLDKKLGEAALAEIERQAGILGLSKATRVAIVKAADKIVRSSMHSATFSQRIWANQTTLMNRLQEGLERSILQGVHPHVWSRGLRDLLTQEMADTGKQNAAYAANRIAVTETARVQVQAAKESFRKAGFKKYIWITHQDERTCVICGPRDGMIFDLDDTSVECPEHPFCRCSIAAYSDRSEAENTRDMGYNSSIRMDLQLFAKGPRFDRQSKKQREKSVRSFEKNIDLHKDKIANPEKYVQEWGKWSERRKQGQLDFWEKEVARYQTQMEQALNPKRRR